MPGGDDRGREELRAAEERVSEVARGCEAPSCVAIRLCVLARPRGSPRPWFR